MTALVRSAGCVRWATLRILLHTIFQQPASGPWGKSGRLVPELKRYFVPVPKNETKNAEVLVYEVQ